MRELLFLHAPFLGEALDTLFGSRRRWRRWRRGHWELWLVILTRRSPPRIVWVRVPTPSEIVTPLEHWPSTHSRPLYCEDWNNHAGG